MNGEINKGDTEELLLPVDDDVAEFRPARGRLKIFLGAAAGVGKTYRMLSEAQELCAAGVDVVVGIAETHGRAETEKLLEGLEVLPRKKMDVNGVQFLEMDLAAIIGRNPRLVLIDELAHMNVPGSRHAKRYQDVEDVLDDGIDVYTTLNVQHLESQKDVVQQITGVKVGETVPDWFLENADEVELVDITPEVLLKRFRAGKVYVPEKAEQAMQRFFKKGNIFALRQLALRYTARHVEGDLKSYTEPTAPKRHVPVGSRILVCLTPSDTSERLVRIAHSLAVGLETEWLAVYVESPKESDFTETALKQLAKNMWLVEELGGKMNILFSSAGTHLAQIVMEFVRENDVDLIVAGSPNQPRWRKLMGASFTDELIHMDGAVNVLVIGRSQVEAVSGPEFT
ncbi:MAG: universal stress protein [Candidatus Geothermincolia bacterium]